MHQSDVTQMDCRALGYIPLPQRRTALRRSELTTCSTGTDPEVEWTHILNGPVVLLPSPCDAVIPSLGVYESRVGDSKKTGFPLSTSTWFYASGPRQSTSH
jgi:hypothetical protein